jgi:hypothetical protein
MGFVSTLQHAFNIFKNKDPSPPIDLGPSFSIRQDRPRLSSGNERSIVTAVFNRIAVDVASLDFRHVRVDDEGFFTEIIKDDLNYCLSDEANIDQTGRTFIQDLVMSLLDEGNIAAVAVDTDIDPEKAAFRILSMRRGRIRQWKPMHIIAEVYDERTGQKRDITVSKANTAILENPFYAVMNEPSSTYKRLIRKLNMLDNIDAMNSSGKLDLIIQLPYITRTPTQKAQAEDRLKSIEKQLANSQHGIAYTDGTEKVIQLNRPVENTLMSQIEYLTSMLYSQLSINQAILDGTADENTKNNYFHNTIEPIATTIAEEFKRSFLTKTARTQGQSIMYFRDLFKLVTLSQMADVSDKLTRNEIVSSNEIRQRMALRPRTDDPNADALRNKNMPVDDTGAQIQNEGQNQSVGSESEASMSDESGTIFNQLLDELESEIDSIISNVSDEEEEDDNNES